MSPLKLVAICSGGLNVMLTAFYSETAQPAIPPKGRLVPHFYPQTSSWTRRSPMRTLTLCALPMTCVINSQIFTAGLYACESQAIISIGHERAPTPTPSTLNPLEEDNPLIVEFNANLGTPVRICHFHTWFTPASTSGTHLAR